MALLNFNAEGIEPMQSCEALPSGSYVAVITDTEMKSTKAGNGEYLQITFEVEDDGQYNGRKLWARLNLNNANKKAEEIAARELSAICAALGIGGIEDSDELHGQALVVDVGVEENPTNGKLTNRIKGYSGIKKSPKPAPAPTQAGKPAAKPWQRAA